VRNNIIGITALKSVCVNSGVVKVPLERRAVGMHTPVVATLNGSTVRGGLDGPEVLCHDRNPKPTKPGRGLSWYDNGTWSFLRLRLCQRERLG
jgi:hypothetical protein